MKRNGKIVLAVLCILALCCTAGVLFHRSLLQDERHHNLKADSLVPQNEVEFEKLVKDLRADLSLAKEEVKKQPKERALLENSDPESEPVTPACPMNPPTASGDKSEVPPFPIGFHPLSETAIAGVKKFLYFIGYGRSGHSIIASMLDAHPNIIIAHEYSIFENLRTMGPNAFDKGFIFNELYWNSYESAVCRNGWRNVAMNKKNYTLDIPGLWQGRFEKLLVIGDKAAGYTAMEYHNSPKDFTELYSNFLKTIDIPVQVIHVVRNPYDIMANEQLYMNSGANYDVKLNASSKRRFFQPKSLNLAINRTFTKAQAVMDMKVALNLKIIDIHLEDFVVDPIGTMQRLCNVLGVKCSERYLLKCYDKTFKELPKTRDFVWWQKHQLDFVKKRCQDFPFFERYEFYKDF